MRIGFIGLGNVGAKLAGSVLRNGFALTIHDINPAAENLLATGPGGRRRRRMWPNKAMLSSLACRLPK